MYPFLYLSDETLIPTLTVLATFVQSTCESARELFRSKQIANDDSIFFLFFSIFFASIKTFLSLSSAKTLVFKNFKISLE